MNAQLDIDFARAARDEGIQRAVDHAETDAPGWSVAALNFLRSYSETHQEFAGFFVVMAAEHDKAFPVTTSSRAWGSIFTKAVRMGIIADSHKTIQHPRRHASKAIVWTSLVYRGVEKPVRELVLSEENQSTACFEKS